METPTHRGASNTPVRPPPASLSYTAVREVYHFLADADLSSVVGSLLSQDCPEMDNQIKDKPRNSLNPRHRQRAAPGPLLRNVDRSVWGSVCSCHSPARCPSICSGPACQAGRGAVTKEMASRQERVLQDEV